MHILILGAGAMGSLLGARLSQTECRVTLLSTNRAHMDAIRQRGLTVEELDGTLRQYNLPSFHDHRAIREPADLVMITVKTYDTQEAVTSTQACCHASTLFLTLQNGIGNWERISALVGKQSVLAGITAQGCTLVEPGRVRHGGNGPTHIGEFQGPATERVLSVVELFRKAQLETHASDQVQQLVWEKLLVNVGINAITALTGIRNGMVAKQESGREVCKAAVEEAMRVARARGFTVRDDMVERVLSVARATAVNRSSMGQDVDRRQQTEIDAINGAVVRFAEEASIAVPVNRALTQLVKLLEAGYLGNPAGAARV